MRNSLELSNHAFFTFVRTSLLASLVGCAMAFLSVQASADTFEEIAAEDSVIASGRPDTNMDSRKHSGNNTNMLFHTWDGGNLFDDYASPAAAAASQEYFIFNFDFTNLPSEATITTTGDFTFDVWYTHCTDGVGPGPCAGSVGPPHPNTSQQTTGEFEFYEITAGNSGWEGNQFNDGSISPGSVTFNSLNGTFTKLDMVTEADTGEGGVLVPGKLISNGIYRDQQQVSGIPIATLERLRSGASLGLAMGSIPDVGLNNFSIHSSDSGANGERLPTLLFDFTTGVVLDPADFDEDGDVDATDLATWQAAYGSGVGGDTDSDSDSDGADFLAWQQGFTGAGITIAAVPEPTSMCLVCFGGLAALNLRRRRTA